MMRRLLVNLGFAAILVSLPGAPSIAKEAHDYDVVLRGGTVIDGTGAPGRKADLAIRKGRIVAIGKVPGKAARTIDTTGLVVAPGFIDMHSHTDTERLRDPHGPSVSLQGISTEVWGESSSMAPLGGKLETPDATKERTNLPTWTSLGGFFDALEHRGSSANFVSYVGTGQVRAYVVGYDNRDATPAEIEQEKAVVRQAMLEGAMGVSSGLSYAPNIYMSTNELTALAAEAGKFGGIYATHVRTVNGQDPNAIREAVQIAEAAHVPLHLFHFNSIASWSAPEFIKIVKEAQNRGVRISADAYPYTWGVSGLKDYLPSWALDGGREAMLKRLRDPETRKRITKGFLTDEPHYATIGWENVRLGVNDPTINRKLVTEVAAMRGVSPDDAYMDVVLEQKGEGLLIDLNNHEDTLRLVMGQDFVSVGSDGEDANLANSTSPLNHPRALATYPRWLGHYVREERLMSLEEAVRKMTSLPASILGLKDRGRLKEGTFADVVVFDPATIIDKATFQDPNHYSKGIRYLFVNGEAVVAEGEMTSALPGKALRGPGYKKP